MQAAVEHSLNFLRCDSAVVVSDLHLGADTPQLLEQFQTFCLQLTPEQTQVFIVLGDLFEAYCGDDDRSDYIVAVENTFLALHARGIQVAFMHGNRDFLIKTTFTQRCRVQMLQDPCVLQHPVKGNTLLSHGDAWCVLDEPYQAFRRLSRTMDWQSQFLAQPLLMRQAQVKSHRQHAKLPYQSATHNPMMDVVDTVMIDAAEYYQCTSIVHGHTHKPNVRLIDVVRPEFSAPLIQYVLSDWDEALCRPISYAKLSFAGDLRLIQWSADF
jgi:UDP-2,3-diacylglucosamine hydrolase